MGSDADDLAGTGRFLRNRLLPFDSSDFAYGLNRCLSDETRFARLVGRQVFALWAQTLTISREEHGFSNVVQPEDCHHESLATEAEPGVWRHAVFEHLRVVLEGLGIEALLFEAFDQVVVAVFTLAARDEFHPRMHQVEPSRELLVV